MASDNSKLDHANVAAGFDSQQDSEDALLGIRSAGFSDSKIGYFYPSGKGQMRDHLANDHRFAATIIGGLLGIGAGMLFARWGQGILSSIDVYGLTMTSEVFGALFFGMVGGLMGIWSSRRGSSSPVSIDSKQTYILTVDAGEARERIRKLLEHAGGRDVPLDHQPHAT